MTTTLTFTEGPDRFTVGTTGIYDLSFLGGGDTLVIHAGTTTAHMGEGNDVVDVRGGGNHALFGDTGDDRFNLSVGADGETLSGGGGNDLFVAYGASVGGSFYGDAGDDRFYNFANMGGRTATLFGGAGNDLYRITNSSLPTIVELAGDGIDKVQVANGISYTLGANLDNLTVIGGGTSAASNLTGNALGNHITGGANDETISGLGGNDVLAGGGGADLISGGDGNDRIYGGLGGDTLQGGSGSDVFVYSSVQESVTTAFDVLHDFDIAHDRINLSAIDANTLLPGVQDFIWGGQGVGHLTMEYDDFWWRGVQLRADTNGDGMVDLYIQLDTQYLAIPGEHNFIF